MAIWLIGKKEKPFNKFVRDSKKLFGDVRYFGIKADYFFCVGILSGSAYIVTIPLTDLWERVTHVGKDVPFYMLSNDPFITHNQAFVTCVHDRDSVLVEVPDYVDPNNVMHRQLDTIEEGWHHRDYFLDVRKLDLTLPEKDVKVSALFYSDAQRAVQYSNDNYPITLWDQDTTSFYATTGGTAYCSQVKAYENIPTMPLHAPLLYKMNSAWRLYSVQKDRVSVVWAIGNVHYHLIPTMRNIYLDLPTFFDMKRVLFSSKRIPVSVLSAILDTLSLNTDTGFLKFAFHPDKGVIIISAEQDNTPAFVLPAEQLSLGMDARISADAVKNYVKLCPHQYFTLLVDEVDDVRYLTFMDCNGDQVNYLRCGVLDATE